MRLRLVDVLRGADHQVVGIDSPPIHLIRRNILNYRRYNILYPAMLLASAVAAVTDLVNDVVVWVDAGGLRDVRRVELRLRLRIILLSVWTRIQNACGTLLHVGSLLLLIFFSDFYGVLLRGILPTIIHCHLVLVRQHLTQLVLGQIHLAELLGFGRARQY